MKYNWILDVLADLETFASANDMPVLAAEIAVVKATAASEIAAREALENAVTSQQSSARRPH